jgi:polyhydroxyalkanoate synthesis repressor PhaR
MTMSAMSLMDDAPNGEAQDEKSRRESRTRPAFNAGDHMPKGPQGVTSKWGLEGKFDTALTLSLHARRRSATNTFADASRVDGTRMTDQGQTRKPASEKVVIQKYANRRLYNKATSTYITLDDLAVMVREGTDFVVYDAKTGEDITRKVLTQIIFEEESRGQNLLPIQFLRQLIRFYGDQMQAFLPSYLELSLDSFIRQQERLRSQLAAMNPAGIGAFEEQIRQNLALFDRAMKMFSPFSYRAEESAPAPSQPETSRDDLADLKRQMAAMQEQLAALAKK